MWNHSSKIKNQIIPDYLFIDTHTHIHTEYLGAGEELDFPFCAEIEKTAVL